MSNIEIQEVVADPLMNPEVQGLLSLPVYGWNAICTERIPSRLRELVQVYRNAKQNAFGLPLESENVGIEIKIIIFFDIFDLELEP